MFTDFDILFLFFHVWYGSFVSKMATMNFAETIPEGSGRIYYSNRPTRLPIGLPVIIVS